MSRIGDLIAELCPDGVEKKQIREVVSYEQPTKYLAESFSDDESLPTPVLTPGQTFLLGWTDELDGICDASPDNPCIIFDDFTTAFKWVDFPFKVRSSALKILRAVDLSPVELRFMFHMMQTIPYQPQDHARQWVSRYSRFKVFVPPFDIQGEVVRILDLFTSLEAELEAELEARRKQYEFYRDQLLTFPEGGARWTTLGECGIFVRGNGLQKNDLRDSGFPAIHYGQIHTKYGISTDKTCSFVAEEQAAKLRKLHPGDLAIATTSEDLDAVGKATAWVGDSDAAVGGDLYVYRHEFDPKYISYFFQSEHFQSQKTKFVTGTKVKRISDKSLSRIQIPVPPLAEQARIASILDKFDTLVNDISEGIPAEIEARRQQYEYYRDKLLTFKEKVA